MAVSPVPAGYSRLTPYIIVRNAADAIAFYQKAFGAEELYRLNTPDGKVGHAELKVAGAVFMLADEVPDMGFRSPESIGGSATALLLYVDDVDTLFEQALEAGADLVKPLADQFYGDRAGTISDPFGHVWTLATHIEDVSPAEIQRRFAEATQEN